ncbi:MULTISPECIES: hypothetical protein [Henriciella]|jgi:hypothetical protein|uniref:Uncharacterized protein n=1 Tax=Henriciella pelagia TaxID=1977912 RepID=A0ABQ1JBV7_9PROT|nr:hypothetical protein [Henriciella pelagia]GGB64495.1 hypothetical protein GCM10011503_11610 [Henriciella pelagia]
MAFNANSQAGSCWDVGCSPDKTFDIQDAQDALDLGIQQYEFSMDAYGIYEFDPIRDCFQTCQTNYENTVTACHNEFALSGVQPWVPQPSPTTQDPNPAPITAYQWCIDQAADKQRTCLGPFGTTYKACMP